MRAPVIVLTGIFLASGICTATALDDGHGYRFPVGVDAGFAGLRGSLAPSTKPASPLRASYVTGEVSPILADAHPQPRLRRLEEREVLYRIAPLPSSPSLHRTASLSASRW